MSNEDKGIQQKNGSVDHLQNDNKEPLNKAADSWEQPSPCCCNSQQSGQAENVSQEKLDTNGQERRDFLTSSLGIVGACGAVALTVPFIDQLRPASSEAEAATLDVDISKIKPGEELTVRWRGQPVIVRNRTQAEIDAVRKTPLADLEDALARNANLSQQAKADDMHRSAGTEHENWLVFINICTHLGCPTKKVADGYFCPCHGSRYDMAARVTKGPANKNMAIPPYRFLSDTVIQIG